MATGVFKGSAVVGAGFAAEASLSEMQRFEIRHMSVMCRRQTLLPMQMHDAIDLKMWSQFAKLQTLGASEARRQGIKPVCIFLGLPVIVKGPDPARRLPAAILQPQVVIPLHSAAPLAGQFAGRYFPTLGQAVILRFRGEVDLAPNTNMSPEEATPGKVEAIAGDGLVLLAAPHFHIEVLHFSRANDTSASLFIRQVPESPI